MANIDAAGARYAFYEEEMTDRWAVICQTCYSRLDNAMALAAIDQRLFNLPGVSQGAGP